MAKRGGCQDLVCGCLLAVCSGCVFPLFAAQADSVRPKTMSDLQALWQRREQEVQSARVRYQVRQMLASGSKVGFSGRPDNARRLPATEVRTEVDLRLTISDGCFRFSMLGPQWDNRAEALVDAERLLVCDGEQYTLYDGVPTADDRAYRLGFVYKYGEKSLQEMGLLLPYHVPLFHSLRPAHARFAGGRSGEWSLTDEGAEIAEYACLVIQSTQMGLVQKMWLDLTRHGALRKWTVDYNSRPVVVTEVEYDADGVAQFLPRRWSTLRYQTNADELAETWDAELVEAALNEPVGADEFRVDFGPGALVTEYDAPNSASKDLVRAGGQRRPIAPEEIAANATYTQLANSDPPSTDLDVRPSRKWPLLVGVAVLATLMTAIVMRNRRAQLPRGPTAAGKGPGNQEET